MRQTLAVVVGGLLTLLGTTSAFAEGTNLTGRPAPEISASDGFAGWSAGMSLAANRGSPVAIKFLFASCPACRASMPEFEALYRAYGPRGVRFVAVAYDDRGPMESLWRRSGFTVPVALDPSGATSARYGVRSYPTTYVVGADGIVFAYQQLSAGVLEAALSAAGAARTPSLLVDRGVAARPGAIALPRGGASGSASEPIDPRSAANLEELGPLPPALAGVRDAARRNDYGEVLRIAESHVDPAHETPEVREAALRVRTIALRHRDLRIARIETRWRMHDPRGAYLALLAMAKDFRDTTAERPLVERAHRVYAALTGR